MFEVSPQDESPLRQCEVVSRLRRARLTIASVENDERPVVDFEEYDYAILMTQDCDLDLDYKARRGEVSGEGCPGSPLLSSSTCGRDAWRTKDQI